MEQELMTLLKLQVPAGLQWRGRQHQPHVRRGELHPRHGRGHRGHGEVRGWGDRPRGAAGGQHDHRQQHLPSAHRWDLNKHFEGSCELLRLIYTGWRRISEIMYDSTVTSVWLLLTFSAYRRLTRYGPFDKISIFSLLEPLEVGWLLFWDTLYIDFIKEK